MSKLTITDIDVRDRRVLLRVDFNVPIEVGAERLSAYDHRLRAALPTIYYLLGSNSQIILSSHLGRPEGKIIEDLRLAPIAQRLEALLLRPVSYARDSTGPIAEKAVSEMRPRDILLLENLRFNPNEENNDTEFARSLASLADVFIMDAFGVAHRSHASTTGVPQFLLSASGFLLQREIEIVGQALHAPSRPFAAILGGSKVSDKIRVIDNLLEKVDHLLIGGGMVATFLSAMGYNTGNSEIEKNCLEIAKRHLDQAKKRGVSIHLPVDVVVAETFGAEAQHSLNTPVDNIPQGWVIMDIGRQTIEQFNKLLSKSKTIMWNGPMGVFEFAPYARGTRKIAYTMANSNATTLVGGGSTAEAVEQMGLLDRMTHVSTGGGASLEFLKGNELPGVAALPDRDSKNRSEL